MSALSVQGVSSFAGKSLVVTALARAFARRGVRVAPFKAQNMSNNARVVDGGEIGTAQYLQALAAGVRPDVRMNPVLVKPEADDRSQVVVLGEVDRDASRRHWRDRPPSLWPVAERALRELLREFELVILEGAGSPAETNLRSTDLSNMRAAHAADAPVLLVADIDRGGAFAHLYGTWALVTDDDRSRLSWFVLNKFRGDERLLAPAPDDLERATGMAYIGLLPFVEHGLPDEDGAATPPSRPRAPRVAVIRYPTASNLDELKVLEQVADLVWAQAPDDLIGAELIVLPGSKHVSADLAWLRARGFERAVNDAAGRHIRVLGICGGLQMLGGGIADPSGVDGDGEGLGLLPVRTTFAPTKRTDSVELTFAPLPAPWQALSGRTVRGYEIRHGETTSNGAATGALPDGRGFVQGAVLGIAIHGLLEEPKVVAALLGRAPERTLDAVFDGLASLVEDRLDLDSLARAAGVG
ncbi:MAG TPA: cobyric acid synthase [Gaiellaceae bacterium]|nr:cobyric acid synthase [Gaiellaceae bacterium]